MLLIRRQLSHSALQALQRLGFRSFSGNALSTSTVENLTAARGALALYFLLLCNALQLNARQKCGKLLRFPVRQTLLELDQGTDTSGHAVHDKLSK